MPDRDTVTVDLQTWILARTQHTSDCDITCAVSGHNPTCNPPVCSLCGQAMAWHGGMWTCGH
jgi:hypothetical protein